MKPLSLIPIVTGAGLCLLAFSSDLSAQRPPSAKPPPLSPGQAPEPPDPQFAPFPDSPDSPKPPKGADRNFERDRRGASRLPAPYELARKQGVKIEPSEDDGEGWFNYDAGRRSFQRVTIVSDNSVDAKKRSEIEEDFAVMSRIFQKQLRTELGRNLEEQAMGIVLESTERGRATTGLYLQGYGALFMLNVNFPITATDDKDQEETKEAPITAWEKARRELHTPRDRMAAQFRLFRNDAKRTKYDEGRVDSLKDALFEGLRSASNLRHLAPNDSVVVIVTGSDGRPGGGAFAIADGRFDMYFGAESGDSAPARASGHVLTIRIKKSDLDALAAEKASSRDDLRKRAQITTY